MDTLPDTEATPAAPPAATIFDEMPSSQLIDEFPAIAPTRKRTRITWIAVVGVAVVAALVAAAAIFVASRPGNSASPGVAAVGSTPTTTTQSTTAGQSSQGGKSFSSALAYSVCMRSHGVPDFPDPGSQGGISISIHGTGNGDLNPNAPQFQAAQTACAKLLPGGNLTPAQLAQARSQELKLASCMRAHGIKDFPDPNSNGQTEIRMHAGSDLDPRSPQFQAAQKACQSVLPGKVVGGMSFQAGPAGGAQASGGGQ